MNNSNYFKDMFESITDYRKTISLIFFFKMIKKFLKEVGFGEKGIIRSNLEFKNYLIEQHEE